MNEKTSNHEDSPNEQDSLHKDELTLAMLEMAPPLRQRSPRVPVNFQVTLSGLTTSGEAFEMQAEAVRVSRAGATLIADVPVSIGAIVGVLPPFGGTQPIEAEVNGVWIDEEDKRQRIGVKLLDPRGWFTE
jgi:hypothetical protein